MRNALRNHGTALALLALAWGASAAAHAAGACDLVTSSEASRLLGVTAGKKLPQKTHSKTPGCLIQAAGGDATLELRLDTVALEDAPRLLQHVDDERGDEKPSLHGEPWYEVSVRDPKHPDDRRMIIHRDRTSLTLDLHSNHQKNAKETFEKFWYEIAERLPSDEKES